MLLTQLIQEGGLRDSLFKAQEKYEKEQKVQKVWGRCFRNEAVHAIEAAINRANELEDKLEDTIEALEMNAWKSPGDAWEPSKWHPNQASLRRRPDGLPEE